MKAVSNTWLSLYNVGHLSALWEVTIIPSDGSWKVISFKDAKMQTVKERKWYFDFFFYWIERIFCKCFGVFTFLLVYIDETEVLYKKD